MAVVNMAVIGRVSQRNLDEKNGRIQESEDGNQRRTISVTWARQGKLVSVSVSYQKDGELADGLRILFHGLIMYALYIHLYQIEKSTNFL